MLETENPDHGEFEGHRTAVDRTVEKIEGLVRSAILAQDIRFPAGGIEYGLLDFPTTSGAAWYACAGSGASRRSLIGTTSMAGSLARGTERQSTPPG